MLTNFRSIALSSIAVLLMVSPAAAATRPRYGGTLRVEVRAQVRSVDPVEEPASPLTPLLFDTLVTLDASSLPQPSLAVSWTQESDRRWRINLRPGIRFSDGTPLTAALVAASLRKANGDWNVREVGDLVVVETDQPSPNLLAQLALGQNAIVLRAEEKLLGTGPFTLADLQAGRAVLQARDDGWRPRPFVDRIDLQLGRALRDQSVDLDLGRADLIEVAPEDTGRAPNNRRFVRSDPVVLLALRFSHTNPGVKDARVREAVSLSIDREAISNILLQRRGEPAGGLLPNWMTGYSFLFPSKPQVARARQLRGEARAVAPITLVYRAADPIARLIAERIALNVADAGLVIRTAPDTQNITVPDIELVALRLPSSDAATSLAAISRPGMLALPFTPPIDESPDDIYRATAAALKDAWSVSIAYAPVAFALGPRVSNWNMARNGDWRLEEVSVAAEVSKP